VGWPAPAAGNHFTEMCSGSEAGSYLRLIDSCITQLKAQGPSRTCKESKEEEEEEEQRVIPFPHVSGANPGGKSGESTLGKSGESTFGHASVFKYSVGPSIRPICTRCCFTVTDIIQV